VPFVTFVTWGLCCIDEVAHLIEDCFAGEAYSLQLDPLCAKIERDVLEQIVPSPSVPSHTAAG
jgi:predicted membrane chloride channel (bestrophin family)